MAALETTLSGAGVHVLLFGSFVLGLGHAFEVDHLTAVSAFVATRPRPRAAALFGAKWAIGHGVSLLLFGTALYAMKLVVSTAVSELFERAVGLGLLGLGVWTLYRLRRALPEDTTRRHHHHLGDSVHAHDHAHSHSHSHGAMWMGLLHGIAGTAAFAGQAIVVASQSYAFVLAYTLAFSAGVLVSMAFFAGAMGAVLTRAGRFVQVGLALWACVVGVVWILGFGS